MDEDALERMYYERLEERLISYLSETHNVTLEQAMDIYYRSKLAEKIHTGMEGIQYLDYKVLAQILLDTEPELLENRV